MTLPLRNSSSPLLTVFREGRRGWLDILAWTLLHSCLLSLGLEHDFPLDLRPVGRLCEKLHEFPFFPFARPELPIRLGKILRN